MYDEENFHKKNFILHYKECIDVVTYKGDYEKFKTILDVVQGTLKNIDVKNTTLFVCDTDISKYIYLASFAKLERLVTNCNLNFMQMIDIFNQRWSNISTQDEPGVYYSIQDINEDVLCLFIDKMFEHCIPAFQKNVLSSLLSGRAAMSNKHHEGLLTWVFYKGTIADLKASDTFEQAYKQFCEDGNFQIVDVNSLLSSKDTRAIGSTNKVSIESSKRIDDIY